MQITSPEDKGSIDPILLLKSLGTREEDIETVSQAETVNDLDGKTGALNLEQYLLPMFRPLYERIPEFRAGVLRELEPTGVLPEMIDKYFVQSGDLPGLVFTYKHRAGEILAPETLHTFLQASRACVFSRLKSAFCSNSTPSVANSL